MRSKKTNLWKKCTASALAVAMAATSISALSVLGVSAQENINTTLVSEFQNPPQQSKTMIRYWVPGAAVEESALRRDVKQIADLGYGGLEVVSYIQMIKGVQDNDQWGTENWDRAMEIIVDEAQKYNLTVDVTNGPGWPISSPTLKNADDPGTSYEMTYGTADLVAGDTYQAIVPERNTIRSEGTTKLFAVGAYQLTAEKTIDFNSYIDLMDYVTVNPDDNAQSTLNWTAPEGDQNWVIFSFWEQPTAQKEASGYYVVDHYGIDGANACKAYWDSVMDEKDYLHYVNSLFNDSLENQVDKEWTRGFQEIFKQQKGYDITPYLPVIGGGNYYQTQEGPNYDFTDADLTEQINNDYNEVVTYCYNEYHLKPLETMAEEYGMNIRYQVAYNKPMEVETSALSVAIPEGESLNRASLDNLRMMASAVHMTDKQIYSYEAAAEFGNAYGQSYEDIAWHLKRSWAAGMNRQVLHGAAYSGELQEGIHGIMGDFWPGYAPFMGYISNEWNKNTSYENAADYIEYFTRYNYIMQKESKIDIAVYRHTYEDNYMKSGGDGEDWFPDDSILNRNGYSYEFVNPDILNLETATVTNGVLNENGPAYKAIVIHNEDRMSPDVAQRMIDLANDGMKIVVVGDAPSKLMYRSEVNEGYTAQDIVNAMNTLLQNPNVKQVSDYDQLPTELTELNVQPDAQYSTPTDLLAKHQVDDNGDFYYLYNYNRICAEDANATLAKAGTAYPGINKDLLTAKSLDVTLKGEGKPYLLDAWTGEITPIAEYQQNDGSVTLHLDFDKDEAKLIALLTDQEAIENGLTPQSVYATDVTGDAAVNYQDNGMVLKSTQEGTYTVTANNNQIDKVVTKNIQDPFTVEEWNLQIKSLEKNENGSIYFYDSQWKELDPVTITELKGWKDINPEWKNVAGIGTYTTTFHLDKGYDQGYGAYIDLGEVEDTFTVTVNGTKLPMVNQINTIVDIGPYVHAGENTVIIEVATTIYNQAKSSFIISSMPLKENGLLGNDGVVTVTPYQEIPVELSADTSILNSVIAYAEQAKASGEYDNAIESVQKTFDAALENAKAVANNAAATQEEVNAAWKTLLNEIHKLGFVAGDKTELASLIAAAEGIDLSKYVEAGQAEFTAALEAAQNTYNNGDAMQAEINEVADNLLNAMLNLRYKADKSILEEVVAEAEKVDANAYTAESYAVLEAAVNDAKAVLENENATQKEVDAAVQSVQAAMDSLVAVEGTETPSDNNATQTGQENTTTKANAAKTGDFAPIAGVVMLAVAGTAVLLSRKKK
ncbi:glycosyl hydrolase [Clostridium facile]|uniref:FIVAR domain-containing protein n=1 Tax=Clostridium facile TaxID=2763035 RepID=A0ABR7IRY8_9CLOT|nr:glycosyl hydrolase [Clostridium facile]MBC5787905.1 FIVAR domain-containing protein [Clostridium facile]